MKTLILILSITYSFTILSQEEKGPNPTRGLTEYPGPGTLRVGTWSFGGITFPDLKKILPLPLIAPQMKTGNLPVELMEKYKIDVLCLNDIRQKATRRNGSITVEPPAGTIVGESGSQPSQSGEKYFFQPTKVGINPGPIVFEYKVGNIIAREKVVVCQTPIPNVVNFGGSKKTKIQIASCVYKPKNFRFTFGCVHQPLDIQDIKDSVKGLDKMISKPPFSFQGRPNPFIIGGDFNSRPGKHLAPKNPNIKKSIGWKDLEIGLPKNIRFSPFNDEDITFSKIYKKRGKVSVGISPERRLVDDLIHSLKMENYFIQKTVLPVQTYPLNPAGDGTKPLLLKDWMRFNQVSDHLPVIADYFFN